MMELTLVNGHKPISSMVQLSDETISALVLNGDLSKLTSAQKVEYYRALCNRVGLDPATQPFKLLSLSGKQVLYCDRGGTAQLNKKHEVSHKITSREMVSDIWIVTAQASTKDGRGTESIGAVPVANLKGEALANAMMKAETKAKRRATLDLLGLGMLDESEVDSIPGAQAQPTIEAPTPEEDETRKDRKKKRGQLNTRFKACQTTAEIIEASASFQEYAQMGAGIWLQRTFHNDTEIFSDLLAEHKARVARDEADKSPAGIQAWLQKLSEAGTIPELKAFVSAYRNLDHLKNTLVEDALVDKAGEFGLDHFDEVDHA